METNKNILFKEIALSLNNAKKHISSNDIYCTVCHQPLTDPISMEAGKGRVCRDRTRFTETLSREELIHVEGNPEDIENIRYVPRDGVARFVGENAPRFVNILVNEESNMKFIDRSESNKYYENGDDYALAQIKSFYIINKSHVISISPLSSPKNDAYDNKFINFQDSYREEIKTRENDFNKDHGYNSINSKKSLDEDQLESRRNMIKNYRADNNSKFKDKWTSGEYPIATLMARLEASKLPGAKELLGSLQEKYTNIKSFDYGLTDAEISHGLTQAVKNHEKRLFSALVKGAGDLITIAKVYNDLNKRKTPEIIKLFIDITT